MGVNLWGASPLYENGTLKEDKIPSVAPIEKVRGEGHCGSGDWPWGGSLRMCCVSADLILSPSAAFPPKLRGYEQKRHRGSGSSEVSDPWITKPFPTDSGVDDELAR